MAMSNWTEQADSNARMRGSETGAAGQSWTQKAFNY
jgi:hypothetical protein